jgi:hypothetical protein
MSSSSNFFFIDINSKLDLASLINCMVDISTLCSCIRKRIEHHKHERSTVINGLMFVFSISISTYYDSDTMIVSAFKFILIIYNFKV